MKARDCPTSFAVRELEASLVDRRVTSSDGETKSSSLLLELFPVDLAEQIDGFSNPLAVDTDAPVPDLDHCVPKLYVRDDLDGLDFGRKLHCIVDEPAEDIEDLRLVHVDARVLAHVVQLGSKAFVRQEFFL